MIESAVDVVLAGMTDVCTANCIIRETEKAVMIDYAGERNVWIPRSCIAIVDDVLYCKCWFARKNGIGCYNRTSCRV